MQLATAGDGEVRRSIDTLRTLFGPAFARDFDVTLWDGTHIPAREGARFTLAINTPFALRAAFLPPIDLNPGRAYVEKWIDIQGDAEAAVDSLMNAIGNVSKVKAPLLLGRLLRAPKPPAYAEQAPAAKLQGARHSKQRDAAAIGFHYDQPIEFYRSFLDSQLVYSCAYYDDGIETLEGAQLAKIDYILKKIGLKPGEDLLDIGCGWGALALRAAQRFGARVLGITLSRQQYAEGLRRISNAGLADRARIELLDYRDLGKRVFDKIVSVGMVEHVGRERLATYFDTAYRALRTGGLFLNHGIAHVGASGYRVTGFMARYVFPDGDLLPIAEMTRAAERAGFEVRDIENLREHYARTLRAWTANLEANWEAAIAATDERTVRIWRLYMAGSAQGFARGRMAIFQSLLAKPANGNAAVPPTRRNLYA